MGGSRGSVCRLFPAWSDASPGPEELSWAPVPCTSVNSGSALWSMRHSVGPQVSCDPAAEGLTLARSASVTEEAGCDGRKVLQGKGPTPRWGRGRGVEGLGWLREFHRPALFRPRGAGHTVHEATGCRNLCPSSLPAGPSLCSPLKQPLPEPRVHSRLSHPLPSPPGSSWAASAWSRLLCAQAGHSDGC